MTQESEYPLIAEVDVKIRRPNPLETGMTACFFCANGPAADSASGFGVTSLQDALIDVGVFVDGEEIGGFKGYVRRPKPLISGYVLNFFAENGDQADAVLALGMSSRVDNDATIVIRKIQDPDGASAKKKIKGPYGEQAKILYQSGFFRNPKAWKALGTDEEYREWVTYQKSALSGQYSELDDHGEIRCVAAHVRRVDLGSGTGIKPPYSVIPLTNDEHMRQHAGGESVIGDDDWWRKQRIDHLQRWAKETLVDVLGKESLSAVEPELLYEWAESSGIAIFVPKRYFVK